MKTLVPVARTTKFSSINVHDQQGSTSREVTMYKRPISEISDEHEIRADELCTFQNIEFNLLVQCIGSSVLN